MYQSQKDTAVINRDPRPENLRLIYLCKSLTATFDTAMTDLEAIFIRSSRSLTSLKGKVQGKSK